ncbi:MAG: protein translocase subunit SecF [Thermodesulfobacteriota bacterium]
MQFIKPDINLDFVGKRKIAYSVSILLLLASVVSLILHGGPRYGIDFSGGTALVVKFDQPVTTDQIRDALKPIGLNHASIQQFGDAAANEYRIRADLAQTHLSGVESVAEPIAKALATIPGRTVSVESVDMVGPQVGKDLREKALSAMFYALLFIAVYISGRFEMKWVPAAVVAGVLAGVAYVLEVLGVPLPIIIVVSLALSLVMFWFLQLRYAMGAIVALIHDVTITVGLFSMMDKEFTLTIIAALLTIIGYSLNDTIIVFDRIRENGKKMSRAGLPEIINRSVNETLSRTILTSGTTLLVVVALFFLGGEVIHNFAFALLVGIVVGTYSSVYVASPILLLWTPAAGGKPLAVKTRA